MLSPNFVQRLDREDRDLYSYRHPKRSLKKEEKNQHCRIRQEDERKQDEYGPDLCKYCLNIKLYQQKMKGSILSIDNFSYFIFFILKINQNYSILIVCFDSLFLVSEFNLYAFEKRRDDFLIFHFILLAIFLYISLYFFVFIHKHLIITFYIHFS